LLFSLSLTILIKQYWRKIMSGPIGEFSFKHAGTTYAKTGDGELANYVNFVGTATGYGQVFGTLIGKRPLSEAGDESGAVSWAANAFLEDGSTVGGLGEGTFEKLPNEHIWKISMVTEVSNGDRVRSEGQISLDTLEYTGQLFAVD
jgi:hypothetical protein